MDTSLTFSPLLPWPIFWLVAGAIGLCLIVAIWRRLSGWWLRALAFGILLLALAEPALQSETRENLSNIVLIVVDRSESQTVQNRPEQSAAALETIKQKIDNLEDFETRVISFENNPATHDDGTHLITALNQASQEIAPNRLAGAILITDGQVHDADLPPTFPAPVHVLLTGNKQDWDRRLVIKNAPAFGILDEEIILSLRIEDQGIVPLGVQGQARISIAIDDQEPQYFNVNTNTDLKLPITLTHSGINVLQFNVDPVVGELTDRNNSAVISINGVRDRLRVLLVSGEPYAGERTWRNLLKSDSAVDLVHFTILRPPEKQDGVPVHELSLIAFPTRDLFLEKVDEFDLIIFDRYSKRGLLPNSYLASVVEYTKRGGAVLVATGPAFAGVNSLYRTPLADILPAQPTARVYERGYRPAISDVGKRHPVTENLEIATPKTNPDQETPWGRWFRHIDAMPQSGSVVMTGVEERPLLLLDRVENGRIAMLLSDQAWLWSRGFEGGGPQLELLRRLAHWMMKEPELEEERLTATIAGRNVTVLRRSIETENKPVILTDPDGQTTELNLPEVSPGRWQGSFTGEKNGLYHLSDGILSAVFALGPISPKEFENTIASTEKLEPHVGAKKGVILPLHEISDPKIRLVRENRVAGGRNWLGLTPRDAYITTDITRRSLVPAWALLLGGALLILMAWRLESR